MADITKLYIPDAKPTLDAAPSGDMHYKLTIREAWFYLRYTIKLEKILREEYQIDTTKWRVLSGKMYRCDVPISNWDICPQVLPISEITKRIDDEIRAEYPYIIKDSFYFPYAGCFEWFMANGYSFFENVFTGDFAELINVLPSSKDLEAAYIKYYPNYRPNSYHVDSIYTRIYSHETYASTKLPRFHSLQLKPEGLEIVRKFEEKCKNRKTVYTTCELESVELKVQTNTVKTEIEIAGGQTLSQSEFRDTLDGVVESIAVSIQDIVKQALSEHFVIKCNENVINGQEILDLFEVSPVMEYSNRLKAHIVGVSFSTGTLTKVLNNVCKRKRNLMADLTSDDKVKRLTAAIAAETQLREAEKIEQAKA